MLSSGSGISSVAHQPSCFGVGFSLCWFTVDLFHCLALFFWGKVSDLSVGPLLSVCCDGLLIIFQFCSVIWLWMLLTGSGDELCGLLPALFQAAAYQLLAVCPSAFPAFVYWKFRGRSATCPSSLLQCTFSNPTLLLCVSFQFLVYCSFFVCGRVSLPRVYSGLSQGWLGEYSVMHGTHLFHLPNVSQADLELASGTGSSAPVFSV
jgi:hypothetical protein